MQTRENSQPPSSPSPVRSSSISYWKLPSGPQAFERCGVAVDSDEPVDQAVADSGSWARQVSLHRSAESCRDEASNICATLQAQPGTEVDWAQVALVVLPELLEYRVRSEELCPLGISPSIDHAKANPGKLNYASPGPGSFAHLASELLNQSAGINVVHVAYKGFGSVVATTMANENELLLTSAIATKPMWQTGKLNLLAIATGQRSAQTPDIPTAAEAGLPGFQALFWFGAFLPAATADDVASRLEREFIAMLKSPEIRDKVEPQGFATGGVASDEFRRQVDSEIRQWEEVVRKAGIPRE